MNSFTRRFFFHVVSMTFEFLHPIFTCIYSLRAKKNKFSYIDVYLSFECGFFSFQFLDKQQTKKYVNKVFLAVLLNSVKKLLCCYKMLMQSTILPSVIRKIRFFKGTYSIMMLLFFS